MVTKDIQAENIVLNGEFRVRDANGENQFLVDNSGYVRARDIEVDYDIIPDYVFKEGYNLMPIEELEKYIKNEKHLPNIKSESDFAKSGKMSLSEMNTKLLEKVEELTLYTIQQQKQIDELKKLVQEIIKK
ncbi:MAG: hypothetical protein MUF43_14970 [Flavobacterium sp.]|nr:hypothetical protein [Flavobacterium sp.]